VTWLGSKRGYLTDWLTQQWVKATGCNISLAEQSWLDGPAGDSRLIGKNFFVDYARENHLELVREGTRGLIRDLQELCLDNLSAIAPAVRHFYERTSEYEMDAWCEWRGLFKPFGRALAVLFSRRLQQLNVPLSSLDSSKGMTSVVVQMRDLASGEVKQTAWVRELHATRNVLYAGSYSVCRVPGHSQPCVKVVFPLPHGNAIVVMRPQAHAGGSFSVTSSGNTFGDPGFYFVVHDGYGRASARYVRSLKESIRVYPSERDTARADHVPWLWGIQFLRLHYRMRLVAETHVTLPA